MLSFYGFLNKHMMIMSLWVPVTQVVHASMDICEKLGQCFHVLVYTKLTES